VNTTFRVNVEFGEGLTVVTGISGSGKTSLVFDTLYHEARRSFLEVFELGSPKGRLAPANVDEIIGLGPAVAVARTCLTAIPIPLLQLPRGCTLPAASVAHFGRKNLPRCGMSLVVFPKTRF